MIKLTATALIHYISPVIQVTENFQKRELILNDSWSKDGKDYPNFVLIEFSGDKMQQLDYFAPGQRVTVEAYVNGREHNGRYFNTIKGQSVTHYQQQATAQQPQTAPAYPQQGYAPAPPSMPGYPQQGAPAYPQAPGYPQPSAPAYPQQPQYAPAPAAPMPGQPNDLGPDGLPFR